MFSFCLSFTTTEYLHLMSTPMSRARLARLRVYTSTSPLESSPRPHSTPPTSPCTYLHDIYAISTLYLRYIYTPSVSTSLSSSPCLAVAGARAGSSCWHSATLSASNSYPRARQKLACNTVQYSSVQCSTCLAGGEEGVEVLLAVEHLQSLHRGLVHLHPRPVLGLLLRPAVQCSG